MTYLDLREWLQHTFVSALLQAATEYASNDSLLDPPTLFEQCISFCPRILHELENLEVSGKIRIAALRGDLDHTSTCKEIFQLLRWGEPMAVSGDRTKIFLVRAIISVNLFSTSEAEAKCLLWRLVKKMIESFGMRWVRDYFAEAATNPERAFGGHTDAEALAPFELTRQQQIDEMSNLFQLPAVSCYANEMDLR